MRPLTPPDLPPAAELLHGAVALLHRHFAAINAGDLESFRGTTYVFPAVDGVPLARWWEGMRSLVPLAVRIAPVSAGDRISLDKEPHVALWARVSASSGATGRTYEDNFVVWYLPETADWKLACRIHWWSDQRGESQM